MAPHITPRHQVAFDVDPHMYSDVSAGFETSADFDHLAQSGLRYHFCGNGADYWDALCRTAEYGHHELVRLVDHWFPLSLRAGWPAYRQRAVNLVSLGPGNGELDVRVLDHLEAAFDDVTYSCVDASFELLRRAVTRIVHAEELRRAFPIHAVYADFTRPETLPPNGRVDLVTLLGGTLGNYREDRLLGCLKRWLMPESHLLLDAWLWNSNGWTLSGTDGHIDAAARLTRELTYPARNRFVFGPVETATTATARDVVFEHTVDRSLTVVPGAVNIVTSCAGLRARMRLTDEPVDRSRVPLAVTTRYDFEQLRHWFATVGFRVCWSFNAGPVGVFLLRL